MTQKWKVQAGDFDASLPDLSRRVGQTANRVRTPEPEAELPHSDNLLYNYPSAIASQNGVLVVHSSDHRQDRHVQRAGGGNNELGDGGDPFINDLAATVLSRTCGVTLSMLLGWIGSATAIMTMAPGASILGG